MLEVVKIINSTYINIEILISVIAFCYELQFRMNCNEKNNLKKIQLSIVLYIFVQNISSLPFSPGDCCKHCCHYRKNTSCYYAHCRSITFKNQNA